MPELPEVETSCRGIRPHIEGKTAVKLSYRTKTLRWPLEKKLQNAIQGQVITSVSRRAKYLRLQWREAECLVHLGMSGSLRIIGPGKELAVQKHDHVDLVFDDGTILRYNDPRKFGFWLLNTEGLDNSLLAKLAPEPLDAAFNPSYLYELCHKRQGPIKPFIMDQQKVVGVGNIYASESLFMAGIHPKRKAGNISKARIETLCTSIKQVLAKAIEAGGTTLQDFSNSDGKPGYFAQELLVYGQNGPCPRCQSPLKQEIIGGRNTFWCPSCQK